MDTTNNSNNRRFRRTTLATTVSYGIAESLKARNCRHRFLEFEDTFSRTIFWNLKTHFLEFDENSYKCQNASFKVLK